MEEKHFGPNHKSQETPTINGAVTMATRRVEEKPTRKKEEEERWRKLFPDLKKCAIVIDRQKLDRLDVLKLNRDEEGGGQVTQCQTVIGWSRWSLTTSAAAAD